MRFNPVGPLCLLGHAISVLARQSIVTFNPAKNAVLFASSSSAPTIVVDDNDWYGVRRAAGDLAVDFGRVTGLNGSVVSPNNTRFDGNDTIIIVGTIGHSSAVDSLISSRQFDVSQISGQWEAYQIQHITNISGRSTLVIAGADKRGTIFGLYEISQQIGVSPWYWWADIGTVQRDAIYLQNTTIVQGSPSVKYRGIFINDEQPGLTDWIEANYPDVQNGAGFNHIFYSTVFELLLRLRANYMWPAMWGSMFYVDDDQNAKTADDYGIVMGTSHTEPMARATNEQASPYLQGPWSWSTNRANVTEFMRQGAERASPYETLFTLGMRGHGDVASPTLNASSLEQIVTTQQQLLKDVYNSTNISAVPQMWCLYKEVAQYYADGLEVPDDVTLLWAEDNWGSAYRLSLANETTRSGGSGIYYHVDYVGSPRDYKWINTISLQKTWIELQQAYARGAQRIWILNVGDLKPLELPMHHFLDLAYDIGAWSSPNGTEEWMSQWSSVNFGAELADEVTAIIANYSMLTARRKYELLDPSTYSLIHFDEANMVLSEWSDLVKAAEAVYGRLDPAVQPGFFEIVLHACQAGYFVHQIHIGAAKNNLYSLQRRTSTNDWVRQVLDAFDADYNLTKAYHSLLDGKWNHMLSQTHLGYQYWQQPMRNTLPPLSYVQTRDISLAGALGITCEGSNATVPGDDMYHALSSNVLTLPPMDPYGPTTRWIEVFSRAPVGFAVNYKVSINHPAVTVSQPSGTLVVNGSALSSDIRLFVSVNWDLVVNTTQATINITTTTPSSLSDYINATAHPYGNFGMPQVVLPLNKTSLAPDSNSFAPRGTFLESNGYISIEAEHYTSTSNPNDTANATDFQPYIATIPGYGRTLSGLTLLPLLSPSLSPQTQNNSSAPSVSYAFFTFTPNLTQVNVTVTMGPALNTNPDRPLRYAVSVSPLSTSNSSNVSDSNGDGGIQIVQPVPNTAPGTLPDQAGFWTAMVSNAAMANTTVHTLPTSSAPENLILDAEGGDAGARLWVLNLWLLEPGLVVQKLLVETVPSTADVVGVSGGVGVGRSYLGPPESRRFGM